MGYETEVVRELKAQLAFSPPEVRAGQIDRIEALVPEIDPGRVYPGEYATFRVTLFRPSLHKNDLVAGDALRRDLQELLLETTRDAPRTARDEDLIGLDAAAARCGVSRATLGRWRKEGLPARYVRRARGRRFLAIRTGALDRFAEQHPQRVDRAHKRRLTPDEIERLIARAQELQRQGAESRSAAARTIAAETNRSVASVLGAIRRHEPGLFVRRKEALSDAQEAELVERFRKGEAAAGLAREFGRSKGEVYRAVHKTLVGQVLETPVKFIHNDEFEAPGAEESILGEDGLLVAAPAFAGRTPKPPPGLPPYLQELYRIPLLSREQERALFRKYNFVKWRMSRLQEEVREAGYREKLVEAFEAHRRAAAALRNILSRCNLRLVVSVAKRHVGPLVTLFDLISEGNLCLLRAVECFDYDHGARFATYTTWALTKHYARMVPRANYRLSTQITGQDEMIGALGDHRLDVAAFEERIAHLHSLLSGAIRRLLPRERVIIEAHFGLGDESEGPKTLEEIASVLGVTRERIRQIETRALKKLRWFLGPEAAEAITA